MAIIGFLAVAVLMAVKDLIHEDLYKGIRDDEITSGVTGYHLYVVSATCLVLL